MSSRAVLPRPCPADDDATIHDRSQRAADGCGVRTRDFCLPQARLEAVARRRTERKNEVARRHADGTEAHRRAAAHRALRVDEIEARAAEGERRRHEATQRRSELTQSGGHDGRPPSTPSSPTRGGGGGADGDGGVGWAGGGDSLPGSPSVLSPSSHKQRFASPSAVTAAADAASSVSVPLSGRGVEGSRAVTL